MRDFTIVAYKIVRVDYNQLDKHFCFFYYMCLKINRSDLSFAVHKFQKSNVQWNVLLFKEILFHASIQKEIKSKSPAKKSKRDRTFFISHLGIYKRNNLS